MAFYKPVKAEATITTPYGIPWTHLELKCLLPMANDREYDIVYSLQRIHFSRRGKHFDVFFGVSAKDHDVSALELNLLLRKYCDVRKAFKK